MSSELSLRCVVLGASWVRDKLVEQPSLCTARDSLAGRSKQGSPTAAAAALQPERPHPFSD